MDLAQRGFLVPVLPAEASAELGAGVYTTPSLELATHLAGVGGRAGAVLVFRVPPVEGLKVWELGREEWRRVVARELGIRKGRGRGALVDVVVGGVSGDAWVAKMERRMPVAEMGLRQAVWRSGEACRRLASALMAVVFLED
ncbi:hypothetical protein FN846DRAFT_968907 [Sphaerosporella brunnea]|uniref:Uncharacterized protein n=1 Tax=Sphaerosporella brunnea TaxID=1250544 RepID=A0A5J5ELI7_9PEZI|nr:hypothetical protein FN846DRAFT_968907 [Sphaerosporella brunnea]